MLGLTLRDEFRGKRFKMKAQQWRGTHSPNGPEYKKLHKEFEGTTLTNDLFVPDGVEDIVFETAMKERILRLCARGKIAIHLRNLEHLSPFIELSKTGG